MIQALHHVPSEHTIKLDGRRSHDAAIDTLLQICQPYNDNIEVLLSREVHVAQSLVVPRRVQKLVVTQTTKN